MSTNDAVFGREQGFEADEVERGLSCAPVYPDNKIYDLAVPTPTNGTYNFKTNNSITWSFANGNQAIRFVEFIASVNQLGANKSCHFECVIENIWTESMKQGMTSITGINYDGLCHFSVSFVDTTGAVVSPGEVPYVQYVVLKCTEPGGKYRWLANATLVNHSIDLSKMSLMRIKFANYIKLCRC